jgi:hypothetical protein
MARRLGIVAGVVFAALAVVGSALALGGGSLLLGPASHVSQPAFQGYYDGHKDTYLITDVSSKAQAKTLHVNAATALAKVHNIPAQWFVQGHAAPGQLAVFGSEPGEDDYNPLWLELFVKWNPGVTPVLLVKDDQINSLAAAHKLTVTNTHIVLNAPIVKVGG